jgi:hypothetical protein
MVVVTCLGVAVAASADMQIVTGSVAATAGNWTKSVTIPKFDPALGTLTSITYKLTADVDGTAVVTNNATTSQDFAVTLKATVTLERPDDTTLVVSIPLITSPMTLVSAGPAPNGNNPYTFGPLNGTDSESAAAPPPTSDLTLFTSTGPSDLDITLPVTAKAGDTYTGHGNDSCRFSTTADAQVEVDYNYYTPEPGTLGLLGLGLPLAGVWFRRRKRVA